MGSLEEKTPETRCSKPVGIWFLEYVRKSALSFRTHQAIVLVLTFFAYASYHATRKTTSIVKSSLDPESSQLGLSLSFSSWPRNPFLRVTEERHGVEKGWAPFDGSDGTSILGEIDLAFLSVYSLGMYFSGHLGDRLDLRIFLTIGMVGAGLFTMLFGFGYWLNIHSFYYFLIIQMLAGLFQSTGWPSVVAVIGNWFGKKKRGLIMGIWNAHTSIGNISGSLIASYFLEYGWGWSFAIPGLLTIILGMIVFLLLPVSPESVGAIQEYKRMNLTISSKAIRILQSLYCRKRRSPRNSPLGSYKLGEFLGLPLMLSVFSSPNLWLTHSSIGFPSILATQTYRSLRNRYSDPHHWVQGRPRSYETFLHHPHFRNI